MKKTLRNVIIIVAVILVLPVFSLLRWSFTAKKPMGIIIVDKTVPTISRVKHKSFNWIITHDRFVKKENNASYSYKKNYYGFIPTRPLRENLWDKNDYRMTDVLGDLSKKNDAVYFTDTYGVFFNEWYQGYSVSRRTRKLYGGMNSLDNVLVKTLQDSNKLVILEYNTLDYPTDELTSYLVQGHLGITFTKWTGKYFSTLDTTAKDFPKWITPMYRRQYNKPWNFTKPGIIFLKDKYIVVLEQDSHLKSSLPLIITDSLYHSTLNLPASVAFDQWFDIIDPMACNIISSFKIETTANGDSLLKEYGLSNQFPAVVQNSVAKNTYYFSGDFASTDVPFWTSRFCGIEKLKGLLYSSKPDDTRRFFWLYYRPLIEGIFNGYYKSLSPK